MRYLPMNFMKAFSHMVSSLTSFHRYLLLFPSSDTAKQYLIRLKRNGMNI